MCGFGNQPQGCEIDAVDSRLRVADGGSVYRLADARIACRTVERCKLDAAVLELQHEMLAVKAGVLAWLWRAHEPEVADQYIAVFATAIDGSGSEGHVIPWREGHVR